jgi:hypothetical protein
MTAARNTKRPGLDIRASTRKERACRQGRRCGPFPVQRRLLLARGGDRRSPQGVQQPGMCQRADRPSKHDREKLRPLRPVTNHPKPPPDRRRDRLAVPPCDECGSTATAVVSRTDYVLYVRCPACGLVWSVPKPNGVKL